MIQEYKSTDYRRKIGNTTIIIQGDKIEIHNGVYINHGMIYNFNARQWIDYAGPQWNTPQIIGMDWEPSKTALKVIYAYIKREHKKLINKIKY